MGYMKEIIKFPCGLFVFCEGDGAFLRGKSTELEDIVCPLHGIKCKSEVLK